MLNKNQSKKWNSLKYALVIPALIAFVFVFQMEVIAQEKTNPKQENEKKADIIVDLVITKNTTDKEIKEKCEKINKSHNINLTFFNIKRNSNGEIINIDGKFEDRTGSGTCNQSENPIKPFRFFYNITKKEKGFDMDMSISKYGVINKKGKTTTSNTISPPALPPTVKSSKIQPPPPPKVSTVKIAPPPPPKVSTVKFTPHKANQLIALPGPQPMIIIDDINADPKTTINDLNSDAIKSINVLKGESAIKKYGENGKNGVIEITTKENTEKNDKTYFQINGPVTLPPIIIINGVKTTSISNVNEINPDAIKSMNVIKGKMAEDKYGKDGKYGVIEIITNTLDPSKIIKSQKK